MKLKHHIMLLLGLPLLCQFLTGYFLFDQLQRLDKAAKQEGQAKAIIATCQELRISVSKIWLWAGAQRFMNNEDAQNAIDEFAETSDRRLTSLAQLVSSDPAAKKMVASYGDELRAMKDLLKDATRSFEKSDLAELQLARFMREGEYLEEFFVRTSGIFKYEREIIEHYTPLVKEFSPVASRERERALTLAAVAVASNTIVVLILAVVFWRFMIVRMQSLMQNMNRFAAGEIDLEPVSGGDEIAELDLRFREMALARHESEEMRRSLQAMVSHDLRSPLTAVSLTISLILEKFSRELKEDLLTKLERLNSQVARLTKLADSFLDLEKLQSGKLEVNRQPVEPRELIAVSIDAVESLARVKKIEIETKIFGSDSALNLDSDRLTQVIVNLLSNAMKYSPKDSRVQLNLYTNLPSKCRFEVIDQGPGVSPDKKDKLFKRFSMLDSGSAASQPGSGLGLYICKMLVEAHLGSIGHDTPSSGGSCFWFEIPV